MNGLMNTGVPPTVSPAASPASVVETAVQGAVQKIQGRREQLREQTDRKIMRATLEIMISKGVAAVTIEEVARRSGVAKTTIYRRYKNADDLLQRIQLEVAGLPDFSDLQPSRSGLQAMLERIQNCFDSEIGLKAVGVVLSSDNDSLKTIADQVITPAEQRLRRSSSAVWQARPSAVGWIRNSCSAPYWAPCSPVRRCIRTPTQTFLGRSVWPRSSGRL